MTAAQRISQEYQTATSALRTHLQHNLFCGREMVNVREQLGEKVFKSWLALHCPEIPWEDATLIMDQSLDSNLARRVDEVMEADQE